MSYLPKEHKKEKKLTEKQQLFLDKILETGGNLNINGGHYIFYSIART